MKFDFRDPLERLCLKTLLSLRGDPLESRLVFMVFNKTIVS